MAMTITVDSGNPGKVLIVIPGADLTSGEAWTLVGSAGDDAWSVRGGSGTGDGATQVALVDPMCPVNATVTYTLTVGTTLATATTTRTYTGEDVICSLDGRSTVDVLRTADGGDPRATVRRYHVSEVAGAAYPPIRLAPVAGAGGGSMQVETDSANTTLLRALLAGNRPVIMLHNPDGCWTGCTVPLTQLVYVTGDRNDVLGSIVTHTRRWNLDYILTADPEPDYRVPLSTWDEFDAAGLTWDEFDALGLTWDEFDVTDWTTVGV